MHQPQTPFQTLGEDGTRALTRACCTIVDRGPELAGPSAASTDPDIIASH